MGALAFLTWAKSERGQSEKGCNESASFATAVDTTTPASPPAAPPVRVDTTASASAPAVPRNRVPYF